MKLTESQKALAKKSFNIMVKIQNNFVFINYELDKNKDNNNKAYIDYIEYMLYEIDSLIDDMEYIKNDLL